MALLRKKLHDRQQEREQNEGGCGSLEKWSPWLTTLLPALVEPLITLLLALIYEPRIINAFIRFIKKWIFIVQLMDLNNSTSQ